MLEVMGTIFTVWVAEEAAVAEQVGQVWDVASSASSHGGGGEELAQMLFDDGRDASPREYNSVQRGGFCGSEVRSQSLLLKRQKSSGEVNFLVGQENPPLFYEQNSNGPLGCRQVEKGEDVSVKQVIERDDRMGPSCAGG